MYKLIEREGQYGIVEVIKTHNGGTGGCFLGMNVEKILVYPHDSGFTKVEAEFCVELLNSLKLMRDSIENVRNLANEL